MNSEKILPSSLEAAAHFNLSSILNQSLFMNCLEPNAAAVGGGGVGSASEVSQNDVDGSQYSVLHFAMILYGLVFLVGVFGNSLVIYVVLRFSKMQTVTNMYLFNLALADEMFLVGVVFLIITFINKNWLFGRILCKVYMTITSINQFTSSLLLAVMSIDRYIAVCHPISAPKYRTTFLAKFICLTVWTVIFRFLKNQF